MRLAHASPAPGLFPSECPAGPRHIRSAGQCSRGHSPDLGVPRTFCLPSQQLGPPDLRGWNKWVPDCFSLVYSRGTLPTKREERRAPLAGGPRLTRTFSKPLSKRKVFSFFRVYALPCWLVRGSQCFHRAAYRSSSKITPRGNCFRPPRRTLCGLRAMVFALWVWGSCQLVARGRSFVGLHFSVKIRFWAWCQRHLGCGSAGAENFRPNSQPRKNLQCVAWLLEVERRPTLVKQFGHHSLVS